MRMEQLRWIACETTARGPFGTAGKRAARVDAVEKHAPRANFLDDFEAHFARAGHPRT